MKKLMIATVLFSAANFGSSAQACSVTPILYQGFQVTSVLQDPVVLKELHSMGGKIDQIPFAGTTLWISVNKCGLNIRPKFKNPEDQVVGCPVYDGSQILSTVCQ